MAPVCRIVHECPPSVRRYSSSGRSPAVVARIWGGGAVTARMDSRKAGAVSIEQTGRNRRARRGAALRLPLLRAVALEQAPAACGDLSRGGLGARNRLAPGGCRLGEPRGLAV